MLYINNNHWYQFFVLLGMHLPFLVDFASLPLTRSIQNMQARKTLTVLPHASGLLIRLPVSGEIYHQSLNLEALEVPRCN